MPKYPPPPEDAAGCVGQFLGMATPAAAYAACSWMWSTWMAPWHVPVVIKAILIVVLFVAVIALFIAPFVAVVALTELIAPKLNDPLKKKLIEPLKRKLNDLVNRKLDDLVDVLSRPDVLSRVILAHLDEPQPRTGDQNPRCTPTPVASPDGGRRNRRPPR